MRQNSIYLTLLQSIHFVFFFLPLIVEATWDRVGWFTFPPGLATRNHCHLLLFQKTAQDLGYVWCPRTSAGDLYSSSSFRCPETFPNNTLSYRYSPSACSHTGAHNSVKPAQNACEDWQSYAGNLPLAAGGTACIPMVSLAYTGSTLPCLLSLPFLSIFLNECLPL